MNPAIVINAYNRPDALRRLLSSVERAQYPPGKPVSLVISIDRGEGGVHPQVAAIADGFAWGEIDLAQHAQLELGAGVSHRRDLLCQKWFVTAEASITDGSARRAGTCCVVEGWKNSARRRCAVNLVGRRRKRGNPWETWPWVRNPRKLCARRPPGASPALPARAWPARSGLVCAQGLPRRIQPRNPS